MNSNTEKPDRLRPMLDRDLEMVMAWRNAPEVRKNMYTQQVITLAEHQHWWANIKEDQNSKYLIFEANGVPAGLVNFTDIDPVHKTAFWGFYTCPDAEKGTGTRLGTCALDFAFGALGLQLLTGEVLAGNAASLAFHKKLGFREAGRLAAHKEIDGAPMDVYRFELKAAAWGQTRSKLLIQIESRYRDGS
ncbi:MAG: UDP-4-amino-4,6-dideoxy-N-acetyl-beta-L-altrosamine N-acetyltransferase [Rhodobacteraceae bacterium]|nr:UDP-4-amino-4,6-dideoxy-N-acetyl-beta-L-altrosamine N-acetyltransferase [Paracoccaceae bacterium]